MILQANSIQMKADVAIFISDKIDLKPKTVTDKNGRCPSAEMPISR